MKLPKSVQVGPFRYEVATEQKLPSDRWGGCDHDWRRISLSKDMPPTQQSVTFLHEIVHAVNSVFKADLKERQVEVIANGLSQALGSMGAWPEQFEP